MTNDEYIPMELWREARQFILDISDDVEIFNKFRSFEGIQINDEALKFVAWWEFKRYREHPHALILLYENLTKIDEEIGTYDVMDGFNQLQMKLVLLYRLLRDKGMIDE